MFESRAFLSDLPVTLVTGYLGSGKTTYINERLSDAHGVRYAVMVNDFGELNIDCSEYRENNQSDKRLRLLFTRRRYGRGDGTGTTTRS